MVRGKLSIFLLKEGRGDSSGWRKKKRRGEKEMEIRR